MIRSDIRIAIQNRCGIPTDDGLVTPAVINTFIDRAIQKVASEYDWAWLEGEESINTTAHTATITPTIAGYQRTISCRIADVPLRRISLEEADWWGTTNEGNPKAYCPQGRLIKLTPVPSGVVAVKHRYVTTEVALANDAASPVAPDPWVEAAIEHAAYLCFRRTQNTLEAGAAEAAYVKMIEAAKTRANQMADTPGGGQLAPAPAQPQQQGQ